MIATLGVLVVCYAAVAAMVAVFAPITILVLSIVRHAL